MIVWVATLKADVLKVATPLALKVAVAMMLLASRNSTVPLTSPAPDVTVAVKKTVWPKIEGLGDEVRLRLVAARRICKLKFADVLELKLTLLRKTAVTT